MRAAASIAVPCAVLCAIAAFACGAPAGCASKALVYRHTPERDAVPVIEASRGSTYVAELPYAAGTGYAWTASRYDEKLVQLVSRHTRDTSGRPDVVGGSLAEDFTFELRRRGETVIVFELKRPWEPDNAADVRSVRIKID